MRITDNLRYNRHIPKNGNVFFCRECYVKGCFCGRLIDTGEHFAGVVRFELSSKQLFLDAIMLVITRI
ncbi:hypothetical protein D3C87_1512640 [compost metagenome]